MQRRQWSHHFLRGFPPRKKRGSSASHDFPARKYIILLPLKGGHLIPFPHPQRAYGQTRYAYVITKLSRMGRYLNFLTHGALLRTLRVWESSAIKNNDCFCEEDTFLKSKRSRGYFSAQVLMDTEKRCLVFFCFIIIIIII